MTGAPRRPREVDSNTDPDRLRVAGALDARWALRLALGLPPIEEGPESWELVFRFASRERIAALAWHRSGALIRKLAPADVSARWRAAVAMTIASIDLQLQLAADLVGRMRMSGVSPVLVKGPGLSQLLYGVPWVRCSSDIDFFVPLASRELTGEVLRNCGGWPIEGDAPRDETWICPDRTGAGVTVELHSNAEDSLARVSLPPLESSEVEIGGYSLPHHSGNTIAAYLAMHLTKHWMTVDVPLLYYVDLLTLWDCMNEESREHSLEIARSSGVSRALQWALQRAGLVAAAAEGDDSAMSRLQFGAPASRVPGVWSVLRLADTPAAALQIIGRWIAPVTARKSVWTFASLWERRLARVWRGLAPTPVQPPDTGRDAAEGDELNLPSRVIATESREFTSMVRAVLAAGGSPWVRVRGGSMLPTIPMRGAVVRIQAPSRSLGRGDVVLTARGGGDPVLHRVVSVTEDGVVTRGDSLPVDDPMVERDHVIGVAVEMIAGSRRGPIPEPGLWRARRLVREYLPRRVNRRSAESVP